MKTTRKLSTITGSLIALTMLASATMGGGAQADPQMDEYTSCWAQASTFYLDQHGVTEKTLEGAVVTATVSCKEARSSALTTNGKEDTVEMGEYMRVQLYSANPVGQ